jgi:hypothetical protein
MSHSINPKNIDPSSRIFTLFAGDLDFILEDMRLDLSNMDPHLWVAIRQSVISAMNNNWAEICRKAVDGAVANHRHR